MQCSRETCSLVVHNTQKVWQRGHNVRVYLPGACCADRSGRALPVVLRRQGDRPPASHSLVFWLAFEQALDEPIDWCDKHAHHPLDTEGVLLELDRLIFAFRHCTGRCFKHGGQLCVVVADWSGSGVTRWGFAPGSFRKVDSYGERARQQQQQQDDSSGTEMNVESMSSDIDPAEFIGADYWRMRCIQLEAANQVLQARLDEYEQQRQRDFANNYTLLTYDTYLYHK